MKTTVELPDQLLREAKSIAAQRGQSLRQFLTEAVAEKLDAVREQSEGKRWLRHYGALKRYRREIEAINTIIEDEFERIDAEEWR